MLSMSKIFPKGQTAECRTPVDPEVNFTSSEGDPGSESSRSTDAKRSFNAIEESAIRARALFSGLPMVFLTSNFSPARTLYSYGRLMEGETFHQDSQACASFWNSHV
jgi:hypothetical protein